MIIDVELEEYGSRRIIVRVEADTREEAEALALQGEHARMLMEWRIIGEPTVIGSGELEKSKPWSGKQV